MKETLDTGEINIGSLLETASRLMRPKEPAVEIPETRLEKELAIQHGLADLFRDGADEIKRLRGLTEWRDMSTAKKDGTRVLLLVKNPVPREGREDLRPFDGIQFVGRHPGVTEDGFDIGWNFAAPVGCGGFPDDWFVGWMPLPEGKINVS